MMSYWSVVYNKRKYKNQFDELGHSFINFSCRGSTSPKQQRQEHHLTINHLRRRRRKSICMNILSTPTTTTHQGDGHEMQERVQKISHEWVKFAYLETIFAGFWGTLGNRDFTQVDFFKYLRLQSTNKSLIREEDDNQVGIIWIR